MDHARLLERGAQLTGAIHLEGVLISISKDSVNVRHEAKERIGWPAMTMELSLAPYVEIAPGLQPGSAITLMLTMGATGSYRIAAIVPRIPQQTPTLASDGQKEPPKHHVDGTKLTQWHED